MESAKFFNMAVSLFHLRFARVERLFLLQTKALISSRYFAADSGNNKSLYETLGISPSSTHNEIKKAYYDLTLKYHPDRNENCELAATKFREVAEAYEILGSYVLKKKYDKGLPLPLVKKAMKTAAVVSHPVQYQAFFDSRLSQTASSGREAEIDELSSYKDNTARKEAIESENAPPPERAIKIVILVVMMSGIYWGHRDYEGAVLP